MTPGGKTLKIVIINKSDSTGGAAVVSFRLMEALRRLGADARMLVAEKLTPSPYVVKAAPNLKIRYEFLAERAQIFRANGFNRSTLFQIDTGEKGLPLWKHPLVKEADAVILNWVNQGMLSLKGVERIIRLGKPVIWTMHDMWCMTGICHHAHSCRHFEKECGFCYLLAPRESAKDLSHKVWLRKSPIYRKASRFPFCFVAVSSWLAGKARESSLLRDMPVKVIPNAFDLTSRPAERHPKTEGEKIRLIFGAARIDDPIKGLPVLKKMTEALVSCDIRARETYELILFGKVKYPDSLEGFEVPVSYLGPLHGENAVRKAYEEADILVSASSFETLPGTLVEAQAYGCIPVSFLRGGQEDIVTHLHTGFLAPYAEDTETAGRHLAEEILRAATVIRNKEKYPAFLKAMRENVEERFSYSKIASEYVSLIQSL